MSGGGIAVAGGEFIPVIGGGNSRKTQQTVLAQRFAAPRPPSGLLRLLAIVALMFVCWGAFSWIIIGGAGLLFPNSPGGPSDLIIDSLIVIVSCGLIGSFLTARYVVDRLLRNIREAVQKEYEAQRAIWERTFFCHRCGCTFVPHW